MKGAEDRQFERFKPLVAVFTLAILSYLGYTNARLLRVTWLHQGLAVLSGGVYFLTIFFGPFYIFIATSLQGVALARRVLATCLLPIAWMTKDVLTILESHPLLEALYWYFNPLSIWMACLLMVEMGLGTLLVRFIRRWRGESIKVVTPAPVLVALSGMAVAATIYAWGQGENLFSVYMHVYRFFFGSGA
jgi:hypothetical protein